MTAEDVMHRCQDAGVPAGAVQTAANLIEADSLLAHRGFLQEADEPHLTLGQTYFDRLTIRFSKTPCDTYPVPGLLGADNAAVLEDWLSMTEDEVREG